MNYLFAENISRSFGEREIFSGITVSINRGQRIALVAKNGMGKTSLLNILAGREQPDSGKLIIRNNLSIGYLDQEAKLNGELSVLDNIFDIDNPVIHAVKEYTVCLDEKISGRRLQHALESMEKLRAWNFEAKAKEILSRLQIHHFNAPLKMLSGGQEKRVALARILLHEPDFLILDEPTNHLDLEMIEWLEKYLQKNCDTFLLVTHDRDFLDHVCNEIIELDEGKLFYYEGHYEYYLEKKMERKEIEAINIDKAKNLLRKELDWMRRQPKARATKAKSRIDAFYELKERASVRFKDEEMKAEIKISRLGGKILEFHHAYKQYGDLKILSDFNYKFKQGERVGIAGKNGTGKTTFLNLVTGLDKPDRGKIVTGETVIFGYYRQQGLQFDEDKRVIDVVREIADYIELNKGKTISASQLLERFLFTRNQHYDFVLKLSGGEKRRLYLLTVLMKNPNFLILDEPTNDLDILTQNVLEDFLDDYPGCLLVVSHDRHFMKKITDHLLVFEGNGTVLDFPGNYTEYLEWKDLQDEDEKKEDKQGEQQIKIALPKTKLSYKERIEFDQLEKDMAVMELRKVELTELMQTALPYDELQKYSIEMNTIIKSLDDKTNRWLELSEFV